MPREEIAAVTHEAAGDLSDAQRCLLQELARDNVEGCTTYSVDDTHALVCEDFTMGPGDVLYMPKGVVHYANTDSAEEAYHLTIGLHRQNMQWIDLLHHLLTHATDTHADADTLSGASGVGGAAGDARVSIELMQIYSETANGVHLHDLIPGWLLTCHRPVALIEPLLKNWPDAPSCGAMRDELSRMLALHVGRFGDWVLDAALAGPWKLASGVAEREKGVGQPTDLEAVDHLFWWDGNLTFLRALQPDEPRLDAALTWVAEVVDYHNTTRNRWSRRTKKGGDRVTRKIGESPVGKPTLCDEMTGWSSECRGSDGDRCEVFVAETTTCEAYCEEQGLWCEGAWEARGRGSCVRGKGRQPRSSCQQKRDNQLCRCRRACVDEGPWECHEEGCPQRLVPCDTLKVACRSQFSDIWRKPTQSIDGERYIHQACPMACGHCVTARTDYVDPNPKPPVPDWLVPGKKKPKANNPANRQGGCQA